MIEPRRSFRTSILSFPIAALMLILPAAASAAPADLDPTFGSGGIAVTNFGTGLYTGQVNVTKVQPDGKILNGGVYNDGQNEFALTRLNPDGSLDPTFGTGGKVVTAFATGGAAVEDIAIQPDGKIVAVGAVYNGANGYDFGVARYLPNGQPDLGFAVSGKVVKVLGADYDSANAVAIQADGSIIVGGSFHGGGGAGQDYFALMGLKPDGNTRTDFGPGGIRLTAFGSLDAEITALHIEADGSILASGTVDDGNTKFALAHYNSAGVIDTSWGTSAGTTTTDFAPTEDNDGAGQGSYLQADGKLVVVGGLTFDDFPEETNALARYKTNGLLDETFGTGGKVTVATGPPGTRSHAHAVTVQPDGKILTAGYTGTATTDNKNAVARYNSDGSVDASFGDNGQVILAAGNGRNESIAMQADGKFVVGAGNGSSTGGFRTLRYLGDYVDPPPPHSPMKVALAASFAKSLKSKLKAGKLKTIAGTALGSDLTSVQIAIQKIDKKLLKKKAKCTFVTSAKGKTRSYKAKKKKCVPAKWLTTKGTSAWSYKLTKALKPGKYSIFVRAVGPGGSTQATFSTKLKNLKSVTLTK